MRVSGLWCVAALVACLLPITASAQRHAATVAASEEQTEPYHKHRDTRHGHDHYYPDRGAIVRDLPVGTIGTSYAGVSYRYHDGIWLEPRGPAFMVVAPPVGLVAPTLPLFSTVVTHGPDSFLYCNDTYYRPRPDLGGYEVVNDPAMETGPAPPAEPEALVGGRMPAATPPGSPSPGAQATAVGATGVVGNIAVPLSTAAVGPMGPTAVPVVAREAVPREPSLSGGAMPMTNTSTPAPATAVSAAHEAMGPAATPGTVTASSPGFATPSSGAAAASVPAASLGASAGASASAAPAGALVAGTPKVPKVFLYPKNGQSADQQAHDRYDCYRFAVAQSGFDPLRTTGSAPAPASEQQSDFDRAQGACFEGRGYSNR